MRKAKSCLIGCLAVVVIPCFFALIGFSVSRPRFWHDAQRIQPGMSVLRLAEVFPYRVNFKMDPASRPDFASLAKDPRALKSFTGTVFLTEFASGDAHPALRFVDGKLESWRNGDHPPRVAALSSKLRKGQSAKRWMEGLRGFETQRWEPVFEGALFSMEQHPERVEGKSGEISASSGYVHDVGYYTTRIRIDVGKVSSATTHWVWYIPDPDYDHDP